MLNKDKRMRNTLTIRLTDEEKKNLKQKSKAEGKSLSEYLRPMIITEEEQ